MRDPVIVRIKIFFGNQLGNGTCFGLATARRNYLQLGFLMVLEFTSPTYTLYPGILGNKMTVWRLSPLTKLVLNVHPNIQERK
jgi:hypothetical protein